MKNKELEVQKYKKNYECIKYLPFWSFFIPKLAPSVTNNLNRKNYQKQPFRGALTKRCSENMQQIYRRTPMPKCD